jgi:hypothetical protein
MAAGRAMHYGQVASKLTDKERYHCPAGWVLVHGADDISPVSNAHVINP